MSRLAAGQADALGDLYDRHGRAVYSLACRILHDAVEAEDVVQDTFTQAWRDAAKYEPGRASVAGWLMVLARTRAIDRLRARRVRGIGVAGTAPRDTADPSEDQEEAAIRSAEAEQLRLACAELSDAQRAAIELAYYQGLTHTEIATRLREPLGTVKTRIRSALQRLRGRFSELATEEESRAEAATARHWENVAGDDRGDRERPSEPGVPGEGRASSSGDRGDRENRGERDDRGDRGDRRDRPDND